MKSANAKNNAPPVASPTLAGEIEPTDGAASVNSHVEGGERITPSTDGLRSRRAKLSPTEDAAKCQSSRPTADPRRGALLQVLRIAAREVLIIGALVLLAIWGASRFLDSTSPENVLFPASRLAKVDGVQSRKIYMAILGRMFDVTRGWQHYGKFKDDLTDDATDLTPENLAALVEWRTFYTEHKVYKHVGRVIGRYYTEAGERTPELDRVEALAATAPQGGTTEAKRAALAACNMQWSVRDGKEVWCMKGKGFPRRVQDGTIERCECSERPTYNAVMRLYPDCAAAATRCSLPDTT